MADVVDSILNMNGDINGQIFDAVVSGPLEAEDVHEALHDLLLKVEAGLPETLVWSQKAPGHEGGHLLRDHVEVRHEAICVLQHSLLGLQH